MPELARKPSSSFTRADFNEWLSQRRSEEGLPPFTAPHGRPIFKNWLRDAWAGVSELPESAGLSLFIERDVTQLVAEWTEQVWIGGHPCELSVFEVLGLNRPRNPEAFGAALRRLGAQTDRQRAELEAAVRKQIARIEMGIAEHQDRVSEPEIIHEVHRLEGRQSLRQFTDRAARMVRELALRAANHRMAEGIALHRFHETFPGARARGRRLLFIAGPTNSGKTYQAFQHLSKAQTGVYLAPLRLMAAEFWDRMRAANVPCSLITGEERFPIPRRGTSPPPSRCWRPTRSTTSRSSMKYR